ncbi:MAG: phosphatidylcholine/phosphatidylserine synthase [Saprospiraceae bacterium]
MSIKQYIPNTITLANVFCGCLAILSLFQGEYMMVFWYGFIAGWLDLGDGLAARALNVKSELGMQLDSLADMVTFGVLPGFVMYHLIAEGITTEPEYLAYIGFVVTLAACLRLAIFNLDTRQTSNFIGVPVPANTAFIVGLLLIWHHESLGLQEYLTVPVLIFCSLLSAFLLNSPFPMFSFKMKNMKWQGNEFRYLYVIISLGLIPFVGWAIFAIGFILYVLISLLFRNKIA